MILDERNEFCDATALNTGGAGSYRLIEERVTPLLRRKPQRRRLPPLAKPRLPQLQLRTPQPLLRPPRLKRTPPVRTKPCIRRKRTDRFSVIRFLRFKSAGRGAGFTRRMVTLFCKGRDARPHPH